MEKSILTFFGDEASGEASGANTNENTIESVNANDNENNNANDNSISKEKNDDILTCEDTPKKERLTWEEILKDPEYNKKIQETVKKRLKEKRTDENVNTEKEDKNLSHYKNLLNEEIRFKEKYPAFSLKDELKNPLFLKLTSPHIGMSVEDAFYAAHRKEIESEILKITLEDAERKLSKSIISGSLRPSENGLLRNSSKARNYKTMTKNERDSLKKKILAASMKGEKIFP